MATDAQLNANRANAQLSTGPKSETGKTKSSLNAVKTGLTGRTVLLPGDDAAAYERHVQRFFDEHKPDADGENNLVQSLADTEWRLLRIPALEMGIYALGRLELAGKFENEDPAVRSALIEAQIFLSYQRQLNNLSIQEGRLRKQREKDLADLKSMQSRRRELFRRQIQEAVELYQKAKRQGRPFDPAEFGFEFPIERVEEEIRYDEALQEGYGFSAAEFLARRGKKVA
jgi:ribosomal protein L13E